MTDPGSADGLALGIDRVGPTCCAKVPQIGLHSIVPEKGIVQNVTRKIGNADHYSGIIDAGCISIAPSKRPQVRQRSSRPQERMLEFITWQRHVSDNIPAI